MNFCNVENVSVQEPGKVAVRYAGKRQWCLLPCILFLVGSFCVGAMLLRWCDGQAEFQLTAESVQVWTQSSEEHKNLPVEYPCEVGKTA